MKGPTVVYTLPHIVPSGIEYWRVLMPAFASKRYGWPVETVVVPEDGMTALPGFDGHAPNVVVLAGPAPSRRDTTVKLRERLHAMGTLLVADCCDDLRVTSTSPIASREFRKYAPLRQARLAAADLVTVNSEEQAAIVREWNPNVEVIPDLAVAEHWDVLAPSTRPRRVTVGVAGGRSHARDYREILAPAWAALRHLLPDTPFVVIGHLEADFERAVGSDRLIHIPWQAIDRYQQSYRWIDVGCIPLVDSPFNRTRSPNRWVEFSLAGAASVASPTVFGRLDLPIRIARDRQDWIDQVADLARDHEARHDLARHAQQVALRDWTLTPERVAQRQAVYARHYRRVFGVEIASAAA